jgi:hypothetical protein
MRSDTESVTGPRVRARRSWLAVLRMAAGTVAAVLLVLAGMTAFRSQPASRQLQPQVRPLPAVMRPLLPG